MSVHDGLYRKRRVAVARMEAAHNGMSSILRLERYKAGFYHKLFMFLLVITFVDRQKPLEGKHLRTLHNVCLSVQRRRTVTSGEHGQIIAGSTSQQSQD